MQELCHDTYVRGAWCILHPVCSAWLAELSAASLTAEWVAIVNHQEPSKRPLTANRRITHNTHMKKNVGDPRKMGGEAPLSLKHDVTQYGQGWDAA